MSIFPWKPWTQALCISMHRHKNIQRHSASFLLVLQHLVTQGPSDIIGMSSNVSSLLCAKKLASFLLIHALKTNIPKLSANIETKMVWPEQFLIVLWPGTLNLLWGVLKGPNRPHTMLFLSSSHDCGSGCEKRTFAENGSLFFRHHLSSSRSRAKNHKLPKNVKESKLLY